MNLIKNYWNNAPLQFVLVLGFIINFIASIFSQGYFAYDDHFLIIEPAQSWIDGFDIHKWLPSSQGENPKPTGHHFFYPGLHYILFQALESIGVFDPKIKMLVVRFLHGLWGLFTVYFGYKIAEIFASKKEAKWVGLLLATFCFMPFLEVRQLVEVVTIPLIMMGSYFLIKYTNQEKLIKYIFWGGFFIGMSVNIRYQLVLFAFGSGIALLLQKEWKSAVLFGFSALFPFVLVQGGIDLFIWGEPFQEIQGYIDYNLTHKNDYILAPWYSYIALLLGIYLIPVGLFTFWGFIKGFKKQLVISLPILIFFAFHTYFPNRQERFIFPIIGIYFTFGFTYFLVFKEQSKFWIKNTKLYKGLMTFFWVLNSIALLVLLFSYTKRSRIESQYYLYDKTDVKGVLMESTQYKSWGYTPIFYSDDWEANWIYEKDSFEHLKIIWTSLPKEKRPNYIFIFGDKDIEQRAEQMKEFMPTLTYQTTIEPGLIDKIVHWLNPINKNEKITIYKVN